MKAISVTKYSKVRGFPAKEITRLCNEGIIPYMPCGSNKSPRYLVDPDMANAALDSYLRSKKKNNAVIANQKENDLLSIKGDNAFNEALNNLLKKGPDDGLKKCMGD